MRALHRIAGLLALVLLCFASTGCGFFTIRSWINVIEEDSSGSVRITFLGAPLTLGLSRIQGGFLGIVQVDTREILDGPLEGTFLFADIRLAAQGEGTLGKLCTWADPTSLSGGSVILDLGGGPSSATVLIDLKATSGLQQALRLPPADLLQFASLPIGEGLTLETLLAAQASGETDGLLASSAAFSGSTRLGNIPAVFNLDLELTNGREPPLFDADLLAFCSRFFDQQGADLYYGLNSKSTYLRVEQGDDAAAPLAISLAELGAAPGDTLRLAAAGTYSDLNVLMDGEETRLTAVFSSSDVIGPENERYRVAGALNAGNDVSTESYFECFLIFCSFHSSDISQDFRIDPTVDVVVPSGAQYLFVSPTPSGQWWEDNSGFWFGVSAEVNP